MFLKYKCCIWNYNRASNSLRKKWSFPLRISSVNMIKSAILRICSHLLKKPVMENFIFCACNSNESCGGQSLNRIINSYWHTVPLTICYHQFRIGIGLYSGDCSIIRSRIRSGWVSAFFVMLSDWKQGEYFMKDGNVTVKKNFI